MKYVISVGLGLCSLLFSFSPAVHAADSLSFSIEEYIPEYFKDLEWTVSGSARISGSDNANDQETYPIPFTELRTSQSAGSVDDASIALRSFLNYRFETLSDFVLLTGVVDGSYFDQDADASETSEIGSSTLNARDEHTRRRSRFSADIAFTRGRYVGGDWFARLTGSGAINIAYAPTDDYTSFDSIKTLMGTTIEDRIQYFDREQEVDDRSYQLALELAGGLGRVYNGEYASTAMYMIEELAEAGVLVRRPTADEMRAVSDTIYQYRVSHDVDARLARIDVLSGIVSYLTDIGVVRGLGEVGPFLLQDVLDYFPTVNRDFGWKLEGTVGGEYERLTRTSESVITTTIYTLRYPVAAPGDVDTSRSDHYTANKVNTESETNRLYLGGIARYNRPLDRRWQLDALAELRWYYHDERRSDLREQTFTSADSVFGDDTEYNNRDNWAYISLAGDLTYIHSSRTSVRFGASYQFIEFASSIGRSISPNLFVPTGTTYNNWEAWDFEVVAEYRVAIPTTLRLTASYTDRDTDVLSYNDLSGLHFDGYVISTSVVHYLY